MTRGRPTVRGPASLLCQWPLLVAVTGLALVTLVFGALAAPTARGAAGVPVRYRAGWNLVAGPAGTVFSASGPLYSFGPGDASYVATPGSTPAAAGAGYWAFFAADTTIAINGTGAPSATITASPGQWLLIGDPSGTQAADVTGADQLLVWDAAGASYQDVSQLGVGQGAWALVGAGGVLTLTATGPALAIPTATPTPRATPSPSPAPQTGLSVSGVALCQAATPSSDGQILVFLDISFSGQEAPGASASGTISFNGSTPQPWGPTTKRVLLFDVPNLPPSVHVVVRVDVSFEAQTATTYVSCDTF